MGALVREREKGNKSQTDKIGKSRNWLFVKGAAEMVIARCDRLQVSMQYIVDDSDLSTHLSHFYNMTNH
jgi:magnesium-transporting ATPase (P-type)